MFDYLRNSYTAGKNYLGSKNLTGNPVLKRESAEQHVEYEARKDRCPVRNHIGIIVDRYHSAAIKATVERDENFDEFFSDYKKILHDGLKEAQIVGSCYMILQLNDAQTLNNIDLKVFLVPKDSVIEYQEYDIFAFTEIEDDEEFKIVYTSDGDWMKVKGDNEIVDSGWSGFTELPVVPIEPSFAGVSQVGMLAPIQESLVNLLSLHMEESLQSTYTRHLIGGMSDIPQTYDEEQRVQRMISGKKLLMFKDQVTVNSLGADVGQGQNLLTAIEQTENMLYAVAGLRLSDAVKESGIAKKIELEQFNDIKLKLVYALERAERRFIEIVGRALGVDWQLTSYSEEVVLPTWKERIEELKELLALGLDEEFYAEVKRKFMSDYLLD